MSKTGYPYDNASMERNFNALKTDLNYPHRYHTEKSFMLPWRNLLMFIIT